MKQYFIADNNEQTGPFSKEELKAKRINKQTLIWREGLENWQEASKIEELKDCIIIMPPSLPQKQKKQYLSEQQKAILAKSFWAFLLTFIPLYIYFMWTIGGFKSGYDFEQAVKAMNIFYDSDRDTTYRLIFFLTGGFVSLLTPIMVWLIAYSIIIYHKITIIVLKESNLWGDFFTMAIFIITGIAVMTASPNLDMSITQRINFCIAGSTIILLVYLATLIWRIKSVSKGKFHEKELSLPLKLLVILLAIAIIIPYFVIDKYTLITFLCSCWLGLTLGFIAAFAVFIGKQPLNFLSDIAPKNNGQETPPTNIEL
jgi:hypothetical protein